MNPYTDDLFSASEHAQLQQDAHFDGETYEPERDHKRLSGLLLKVSRIMLANRGVWLPPNFIMDSVEHRDWASVSARLRDLRKPRFGGLDVERRYVRKGLWEYRV